MFDVAAIQVFQVGNTEGCTWQGVEKRLKVQWAIRVLSMHGVLQELVEEKDRNVVGGFQNTLQSIFALLSYILVGGGWCLMALRTYLWRWCW